VSFDSQAAKPAQKTFKNEGIRPGTILANLKGKATKVTLKDRIQEIEREEIIKALKECDWVMARAARKLGITERIIVYKINKYGIRKKEVRWIEDNHEGKGL
jgi:transcriptional regulator with GAF, ATPase, and Fis domain